MLRGVSAPIVAGQGLHGGSGSGVRRSSRDKHAPLEYWRNERKVYNREFRSELPCQDPCIKYTANA